MKHAPHLDPNCSCRGCAAWRRQQDELTGQCGRCGRAEAECICTTFKPAPAEGP